jgi:phage gpG-like protein
MAEIIIRDQVTAVLDAIGAGAHRRSKAVAEAMGLAVVSLTIRSFNDPSVRAAPWPELKAATVARKVAEGKSTAILKARGLLFRSWRITDLTSDHVKVGSDRFYAYFMQKGTSRGVPARPMLPLTPDDQLTPLALSRMVSAARAALAGLLLPRGGKKGKG